MPYHLAIPPKDTKQLDVVCYIYIEYIANLKKKQKKRFYYNK
jgi:hypothetical protein